MGETSNNVESENRIKENKKTSSIARKINGSFMGKFILRSLRADFIMVLLVIGVWVYSTDRASLGIFDMKAERWVQSIEHTDNAADTDNASDIDNEANIDNKDEKGDSDGDDKIKSMLSGDSHKRIVYYVTSDYGEYSLDITLEVHCFNVCIIGLLIVQSISLGLLSINMYNNVRRKLKPINDMARTTQQITEMAHDDKYFNTLQNAILQVNADSPDARVDTHNKELLDIENAINGLLDRMRETYRQQARFVSDASHELRTPISVIQGYANMLDRWGKEDESILDESITAIKNESEHMQKLVEQLLFLARGDSGRNTLKMEEFSLSDLIREVYEESVMIDEKHKYEFSGEDSIITGDQAMIKQSARILIDNAVKYTKENELITIKVGNNSDGVFYSIQDNGIGMNENDVKHMFERFYRSDEARARQNGGTGLGLSIAKWIVDRHNGYFDILSRADIGTRITVVFRKK